MTTTPDLASMSDTPTFANLFLQWSAGGAGARADVYAHLKQTPADAAALEAAIRHELTSAVAWNRTIAAEAMVEVYDDESAASAALGWVFRQADPAMALDAVPTLRKLSPEYAAPRFAELALHTPSVFRGLAPDILHRAARAAVFAGPEGVGPLLTMLAVAEEAEPPLLMGLADTAPRVMYDLTDLEPRLRERVLHATKGYAAGAALWRLTWRVNRDWLASLRSDSPQLDDARLLALLIDVLTEHFGRRPDLAPLVRELLLRLGKDDLESCQSVIGWLAECGRGWSVLLPLLGHRVVADVRLFVFREALSRPSVWPLAHHHAHAVILERASDRTTVSSELLEAACALLRALVPTAGSALPDILDLIVKQPDTARPLADTVRALGPHWPLPAVAVARTLDRLRRSVVFSPDAFAVLADIYAEFARGAWPALVDDTSFDPRTVAALLEQPAWAAALSDAREADARRLADRLISPRAEVRARAAELLRHYPDQMPKVWPALVSLLTDSDERAALVAVPYFRDLASVANSVTADLTELFCEPNPVYAARAVVALWRLGRIPVVADELLRSVGTAQADCAWGWAVLHAVVARVFPGRELSGVLAAPPADVAMRVHGLLNPPELPEERAIAWNVRPATPAGGAPVYWDGVYQCVGNDSEGGLLFLALMCAHGSAGFGSQKIWMIKHQRNLSGNGLTEAKAAVELAMAQLTPTASAAPKRDCVRQYFRCETGPPKALTDLLEHRLCWYRWAGLELLDAWGEPETVPPLIAERVWDRSALVRARALQMYHG